MRVEIHPDAAAASRRAAELIAQAARDAVRERGRFVMALSGGTEPWVAFRLLSGMDLPWSRVHVLQVDERVAPAGHEDRNFTHLRRSLADLAPIPAGQVHPMPVEDADLGTATARYARVLEQAAGSPPKIDLVHLGLGTDGHTASLVPGDTALQVTGRDVAVTDEFRGRRRMTLTYPALNRARQILWLVVGGSKVQPLGRLLSGDRNAPCGRISEEKATLLADRAAAQGVASP